MIPEMRARTQDLLRSIGIDLRGGLADRRGAAAVAQPLISLEAVAWVINIVIQRWVDDGCKVFLQTGMQGSEAAARIFVQISHSEGAFPGHTS
jgi:hypothetical protein